MSKRLKNHLRNGGVPYPCRRDFLDGSPCAKNFADDRSREMHEKDFNHQRRNPKNMQRQITSSATVTRMGSTTYYTAPKKAGDKVHFLIDFLTPIQGKCSACLDEGEVIPLTGKCTLCDPVLTTLAILREEATQKKTDKQAEIDAWASSEPWRHWHGVPGI